MNGDHKGVRLRQKDNVMFLSELSNGLVLRSRCVGGVANFESQTHGGNGLVI